ncbi:MAG: BON domain-containing protein [Planctomyces sp.]|nr:BON domain-containing protein [Planctomyces sp.]
MRKYGKWLLVLGVMAACPAFASADGFLGSGLKPSLPFSGAAAQQQRNQALADDVAGALKAAKLNGYDVEIEVKDGVAVLDGKVRDASHRALATQVASTVPGIMHVENNLRYVPSGAIQQASSQEPTGSQVSRAAAFEDSAVPASGQIQRVSGTVQQGPNNQQVAEQIGAALSQMGLVGYDVNIEYKNGTCTLSGSVATVDQRQAAGDTVSRIPGVRSVSNQLQVNPAVSQTAFAPNPAMMGGHPGMMGGHPGMMPAGMGGPMMPAGMMQPGMGGPTPMGVSPASYTNPHLPSHAWPAYAQYPNSAAVSYPTQYSASAWPYIGPFYPYPQVPLGWREVSLEWDDGYWQLNFNKEKDKWYWVLNPKNW